MTSLLELLLLRTPLLLLFLATSSLPLALTYRRRRRGGAGGTRPGAAVLTVLLGLLPGLVVAAAWAARASHFEALERERIRLEAEFEPLREIHDESERLKELRRQLGVSIDVARLGGRMRIGRNPAAHVEELFRLLGRALPIERLRVSSSRRVRLDLPASGAELWPALRERLAADPRIEEFELGETGSGGATLELEFREEEEQGDD